MAKFIPLGWKKIERIKDKPTPFLESRKARKVLKNREFSEEFKKDLPSFLKSVRENRTVLHRLGED